MGCHAQLQDDVRFAFSCKHLGILAVWRDSVCICHLESWLYDGQHANVKCDATSRDFNIGKGTKQGDPISSIIFNSVLEEVIRKAKMKWRSKKYFVQLGYSPDFIITDLRFADDILLIGRLLPQIKPMTADVANDCARLFATTSRQDENLAQQYCIWR